MDENIWYGGSPRAVNQIYSTPGMADVYEMDISNYFSFIRSRNDLRFDPGVLPGVMLPEVNLYDANIANQITYNVYKTYGFSGGRTLWKDQLERWNQLYGNPGDDYRDAKTQWFINTYGKHPSEVGTHVAVYKMAWFLMAYTSIQAAGGGGNIGGGLVGPKNTARAYNLAPKMGGNNAERNTATLYRNFGWGELNSIKNSGGKFSIHPNHFQGKQFWTGESGLNMWTKSSFVKPFTVGVKVPKSFVTPGHKNFIFMEKNMMIDGFPGGTVLPANLQKFNSGMKIEWIRY